jgi:murein hydrolase activator
MKWRIIFGGTAVAALLAAAIAAQPDDVERLRDAKARAAEAEERSELLRQEAATAEEAADRVVARRAALSAEIDAANAQIAAARARIAIIARRQREQAALLGEASEPLLRLNALLQKMTQQPTALLLAQPGDRRDYIHLRATMASIEPVIEQRTLALRRQLAIQRELRAQEQVAIGALSKARTSLAERRTALAALENQNRGIANGLNADAAIEYERAIGEGERARDLVERIDSDRESGQYAALLAGYNGPQPRGNAAPRNSSAYRFPVEGRVLSGFGELNPTGYRERGIRLAVAPNAAIMAPAAGEVTFAGRYRSFGNIIIIEHGGGWSTLITNVERLGAVKGDSVRQGQIIGNAGSTDPEVMIELRRNGRIIDIAAMAG